MTTRTAPRGLRVLVYVGWAKPVRIAGQGHPHAKPALKCEMRDVAYILSWHWRYATFESLASAWLPSRVAFYPSETRAILGCSGICSSHHEENAGWRCGGILGCAPIKR
ncbi:hypothetical protein PCH_Pc13g07210 [Penicillium rubens Wisconsin 54-1255]|uniref:Uncharacterized protein n=1 Tax=Penicillium rubens (strain ATCC 28089 / DSM 1075 / NRRL 1951 / Wisconsin 54-1255) TaxID=500485 RepID=B6H3S0_PENRW|nr:hypothetical protein PCH_Pc13g07210 [Penicillium rubens Wisconsin 54-1255]